MKIGYARVSIVTALLETPSESNASLNPRASGYDGPSAAAVFRIEKQSSFVVSMNISFCLRKTIRIGSRLVD